MVSIYLSQTWCLYTWSCLDILITMHFSINCSTVICSPTVIIMISWEKPLVKSMAPGSILYHISFRSTLFLQSLLFNLYHKNTKNIYLIILSLSDLTFTVDVKGLTTPLSRWLQGSYLFVGTRDLRVASYWIDTLVLKNWGKYLRYFAASPFPLQGKTNSCSRGSKKDFWRRCRGDLRSSQDIPSTHHTLLPCITLFAIFLSLSSPPLHLCRFIRPFAFVSFSLLLVCLCVGLIVCHDGSRQY